jgi:hypothetical protein
MSAKALLAGSKSFIKKASPKETPKRAFKANAEEDGNDQSHGFIQRPIKKPEGIIKVVKKKILFWVRL